MLVGLFSFVLATGMMLARQPGVSALDTMYAEDGAVFLGQALADGPADAITRPYGGYVHVVPRLLAELTAALPVRGAAPALALESAAFVAMLAIVVFRASGGHIRSTAIRAVLALSMVVVPVAQEEVLNNIANLHWYLLFASVWVLLWVPTSRWEVLVGGLVLLLTAMSDPLALLLLPLAVARGWALGRPYADGFMVALVGGLAAQLGLTTLGDATRQRNAVAPKLLEQVHWYAFYVVGRGIFGSRAVGRFGDATSIYLVMVAVLMSAVSGVAAVVLRVRTAAVVGVFAVMSVLFYLAPLMLTGSTPSRYTVIPVLLLFSMVATAWDGLREPMPKVPRLAIEVVLILVLVTVWSFNFRVGNRRARGPRWSQEVAVAMARCQDGVLESVDLPITPAAPDQWWAAVPCDRLISSG